MNKRTVLASLNKIANQLDIEGLHNEADTVTKVMSRLAYDDAEPVQKSNLQRHCERFEKRVERILKEYPNSIEKQLIEIKKEKAFTLDDMRREDRPEFEIFADKIFEKIRDKRKASTVTKVMSRLAYDDFDERDYYNDKMDGMDLMGDDYMPYGDEDDDEYMEDDDMGFESEPFDYNSPEDEGDMYGEADGSDYGDDF